MNDDKIPESFISPAQFANAIVLRGTPEGIVFFFGQSTPDNPSHVYPIAKVLLNINSVSDIVEKLHAAVYEAGKSATKGAE